MVGCLFENSTVWEIRSDGCRCQGILYKVTYCLTIISKSKSIHISTSFLLFFSFLIIFRAGTATKYRFLYINEASPSPMIRCCKDLTSWNKDHHAANLRRCTKRKRKITITLKRTSPSKPPVYIRLLHKLISVINRPGRIAWESVFCTETVSMLNEREGERSALFSFCIVLFLILICPLCPLFCRVCWKGLLLHNQHRSDRTADVQIFFLFVWIFMT